LLARQHAPYSSFPLIDVGVARFTQLHAERVILLLIEGKSSKADIHGARTRRVGRVRELQQLGCALG
jgi:hypothetical protein